MTWAGVDHDLGIREVWRVTLTNGANTGSAISEVHIESKESGEEVDEVAQIRVIQVTGN